MKNKVLLFFSKNLLVKGSLLILAGAVAGNIGTYLFHLLMGRLLGPVDYGSLEGLISLNYLLGIPVGVISIVLVKFVSSHKNDKEAVSVFISGIIRKLSIWGLLVLFIFLSAFPILKNLIKIDSFILILGVGLFSYFGIFFSVFSAVFQGQADFTKLSFLGIFNTWSKLLLAALFVLSGFKVLGAVYSTVLSVILTIIIGYLLSKKYFRFDFSNKDGILKYFQNVKNYSFSVFIFHLSTTSLYTTDILLARYFLSPFEAGQYAALSILGKIVYFASSPITMAMFPLISAKFSNGEKYKNIFLLSFLIVILISMSVSGIYFLFPELMIKLLYGKDYLSSAPLLGLFAVFLSLYSFCMVFLNYFLSVSKTKAVLVPFAVALFQICLIYFFHSSIRDIINVNILVSSLLFFILLLLYFLNEKGKIAFRYCSGIPAGKDNC